MVRKSSGSVMLGRKAVRLRLKEWFQQTPGESLLDEEKSILDEELHDLFGYHIVQLGSVGVDNLLDSSRIPHKLLFDITPQDIHTKGDLACQSSSLPIDASSVDVVLLPHVLEFEDDPHDILREIDRILIGEGHVIILGFNPISLWGLWHVLLAWRQNPPWSGHFYHATRVKDWLGLLGFEVVKTKYLFYRPPSRSNWLMKQLAFLEKLGNYCWPWLGGSYMIIGKKRLLPLIPTKADWRLRRRLIASGVAEPTTRARQMHDQEDKDK